MRNPSSSSPSPSRGSAFISPSINNKIMRTTTPCCSNIGIKRGPWTPEEDEVLASYIRKEGEGRWRTLPKRAGLLRCGKSCRLRWINYLRPSVKRGRIAPDEEDLILRLHRLLGNRWSLIAGRIPGRTDNEIKNYWNIHLSKKLINQGIDPRTHKPLNPNPTTSEIAASPLQQTQASNPKLLPFDPESATNASENFTVERFQGQQIDGDDGNVDVGEAFAHQTASPSLQPVPVASSVQHFSIHDSLWEADVMSSFGGFDFQQDGSNSKNRPTA